MASDVNVEAGERKVAQLAVVIEEDAAQSKIQWLIDKGLVVKLHNTSFVDRSLNFRRQVGWDLLLPFWTIEVDSAWVGRENVMS